MIFIAEDNRTRNWTFLVYPESAPSLWQDIIDEFKVPWCYCLHDRDINADGTSKKPHFHVVLHFGGKKSYEQVCQIVDSVHGARPEPVHDLRGMVRYLIHIDNPEKAQYDIAEIGTHFGMTIGKYFTMSDSEMENVYGDIIEYCNEYNVYEYSDLLTYALREHNDDWYPLIISKYAYSITRFLDSKRYCLS